MARLRYRLSLPEPHTQLLRIELRVDEVDGPFELVMPSWTPGSYLLREFARNVQEFAAEDGDGRALGWAKTDKNTWRVEAEAGAAIVARYAVWAGELGVRTSHLDTSHAHVNGASVFMFVRGREAEPLEIAVDAPRGWRVTTPLAPADGRVACFRARDYHRLVDSPLEIGAPEVIEFEAAGRPHRWVICGQGNHQPERLVADTRRIVETTAALWGDVPYEHYTFFVHLLPGGSGGLEHRDSCSLLADRWAFRGAEYERFLALVAHEFFHTWNGTRLRPAPLASVDYTRENYTRNLWVVEGLTTYFTDLVLRRSGLISVDRYLERLADAIQRLQAQPGRSVQSLTDSSFDAWIKFYRPDAHTPNSQISYYHKGALVGLLLDLRIREATENRRSLDDLMRLLWERYGARDVGYPEDAAEGVRAAAEEVCGEPLPEFFERYVDGTEEIDFAAALRMAGLEQREAKGGVAVETVAGADEPSPGSSRSAAPGAAARSDGAPRALHGLADTAAPAAGSGADAYRRGVAEEPAVLGLRLQDSRGRLLVTHVLAGSAAHRAGVNPGDELIALNDFRVDAAAFRKRVAASEPGTRAKLAVFRRDELLHLDLEIDDPAPPKLLLSPVDNPTRQQATLLTSWLSPAPAPAKTAADIG